MKQKEKSRESKADNDNENELTVFLQFFLTTLCEIAKLNEESSLYECESLW